MKRVPNGVACPVNTKWLEGMLRVLPVTLATKLAPYVPCLSKEKREELGLPVEAETKLGEE